MDAEQFPEPVKYERTDSPGWIIHDWQTADRLLSYLEPKKRYFAIFTLPDGSYVQCYGGQKALTVEARVQNGDGKFTHWRFGHGPLCDLSADVGPAVGPHGECMQVDVSQVLEIHDAKAIVRQFLTKKTLDNSYQCEDITDMFNG